MGRPPGSPHRRAGPHPTRQYDAAMDRPTKFEEHRFIGDKRTQTVYDLDDDATPEAAIEDLLAAEQFLAFGPDSLAEARNRGYRLYKG